MKTTIREFLEYLDETPAEGTYVDAIPPELHDDTWVAANIDTHFLVKDLGVLMPDNGPSLTKHFKAWRESRGRVRLSVLVPNEDVDSLKVMLAEKFPNTKIST